jgi:predicted ribosomally synthesized peptide with nif11-like leader
MAIKHAHSFLEKLDTDKKLKKELLHAGKHVLALAKKHGHTFTAKELEGAMLEKWGPPKNREGMDDPYTCCCFISEAPGY